MSDLDAFRVETNSRFTEVYKTIEERSREADDRLVRASRHNRDNRTTALKPIVEDVHHVSVAVFGDGNGNKGLIRRVDMVEQKILSEIQSLKQQQPKPRSNLSTAAIQAIAVTVATVAATITTLLAGVGQ